MNKTRISIGDPRSMEAILPEMHKSWGGTMSLDTYLKYMEEVDSHSWVRKRVRNIVLLDEQDDCLSSLYLHAVEALHDDQVIRFGGIARVMTPERLRGHGYAANLVHATLKLLEREGVDGAYLFSDIGPRYYEQFGFATVDSSQVDIPLESLPAEGAGGTVRPMQETDHGAIRDLYSESGSGEALWFLRDPDHWDFLIERTFCRARYLGIDNLRRHDLVLERGGRIEGYALARTLAEELELLEFGLSSLDDEEGFEPLFAVLRREAGLRGCKRFVSPWPPGKYERFFASRFQAMKREHGILMVASLNERLDLEAVTKGTKGSWQTDRI